MLFSQSDVYQASFFLIFFPFYCFESCYVFLCPQSLFPHQGVDGLSGSKGDTGDPGNLVSCRLLYEHKRKHNIMTDQLTFFFKCTRDPQGHPGNLDHLDLQGEGSVCFSYDVLLSACRNLIFYLLLNLKIKTSAVGQRLGVFLLNAFSLCVCVCVFVHDCTLMTDSG